MCVSTVWKQLGCCESKRLDLHSAVHASTVWKQVGVYLVRTSRWIFAKLEWQ